MYQIRINILMISWYSRMLNYLLHILYLFAAAFTITHAPSNFITATKWYLFISLLIFLLSSSLSLSNVNKALLLVSCNTWSYHYKFILFMQVFLENKNSQINLCVLYEYFIYLIFMTLQGLSHERGSHHVLRRLSRV